MSKNWSFVADDAFWKNNSFSLMCYIILSWRATIERGVLSKIQLQLIMVEKEKNTSINTTEKNNLLLAV